MTAFWRKYSIPEFSDNCMLMFGNFRYCTAIACRQCYSPRVMKDLIVLKWVVITDILTVIQQLPSSNFKEFVWAGCYKANIKKHNFPTELLTCQDFHLHFCDPQPGFFTLQPVHNCESYINIPSSKIWLIRVYSKFSGYIILLKFMVNGNLCLLYKVYNTLM
jgi:hypothetical protein